MLPGDIWPWAWGVKQAAGMVSPTGLQIDRNLLALLAIATQSPPVVV
jgi:hypothetical protein